MEEEEREQKSFRSEKEERGFWRRLGECDKGQAQKERVNNKKKDKKVAKASERMKVGKDQPSILEKLKEGAGNKEQEEKPGEESNPEK